MPEQNEVSGEYAYHMGRSEYECDAFGPGKPAAPLFGKLPIYEQAKWVFIAGKKEGKKLQFDDLPKHEREAISR